MKSEYYNMNKKPAIYTDDVYCLRDTDTYTMYCIINSGVLHGVTTTVKLNDGDIVILIAKRGGCDVEVIRHQY